jgi:hypothetical protein
LERASRYWLCAVVGNRDEQLFCKGMEQLWSWGKQARFLRLFSDGEPRYGSQLWRLAALYLSGLRLPQVFGRRKTLPAGVEVAAKVKRSQGRRRIVRRHPEHPYTAISPKADVHANHAEAHNSSIRRRCSAFRRRQNHYAKKPSGLQRAIAFGSGLANQCFTADPQLVPSSPLSGQGHDAGHGNGLYQSASLNPRNALCAGVSVPASLRLQCRLLQEQSEERLKQVLSVA